ncbi:MAG: hypothetical protein ABS901_03095 [Candidatus Limivicinus sp.]|jgi:hypothetical protein
MKFNVQTLMKARGAWHTFRSNHPNVLPFLNDMLQRGVSEDVQIEILVHYPDGTDLKSGIRVKQSDLALFEALQELM